jgi:hypothetical protein
MSVHEQFTHSIDEFGRELLKQSQQTLFWLNRNGYLSNEDAVDLLERMVVVPVRNDQRLDQRLIKRFFKQKESTPDSYVFPITLLEEPQDNQTEDKPPLKLVK